MFQKQHRPAVIFTGKPIAGIFIHRYHHITMGSQISTQIFIPQVRICNPVMISMNNKKHRAVRLFFRIPDHAGQRHLIQGVPLIVFFHETIQPFIFSKPADIYRPYRKDTGIFCSIGKGFHGTGALFQPLLKGFFLLYRKNIFFPVLISQVSIDFNISILKSSACQQNQQGHCKNPGQRQRCCNRPGPYFMMECCPQAFQQQCQHQAENCRSQHTFFQPCMESISCHYQNTDHTKQQPGQEFPDSVSEKQFQEFPGQPQPGHGSGNGQNCCNNSSQPDRLHKGTGHQAHTQTE